MKNLLITIAVGFAFLFNNAYASFPVAKKDAIATQQSTTATVETKNNSEISSPVIEKKASKISKLVKKADQKADDSKELIITLLLWFFLGGFAAHRWYKGKPAGYNILFILTLGGCGIWALIDLVNILTGKF